MTTSVVTPTAATTPAGGAVRTHRNGGFPLPAAGEPCRTVITSHPGCSTTSVRLPAALPAAVVRQVTCDHCARPFHVHRLVDHGVEPGVTPATAPAPALPEPSAPAKTPVAATASATPEPAVPVADSPRRRLPSLRGRFARLRDPNGRAWRFAAAPLAALAVIVSLAIVQSQGSPPAPNPFRNTATAAQAPAAVPTGATEDSGDADIAAAADSAQLVSKPTFTMAIPQDWEQSEGEGGATYAAASPDGQADVTLWVSRDPKLDFATFQAQSLAQLEQLAGSAQVIDREVAPTQDAMVTTLAADAPDGAPSYQVVLRASGPYRYYLATTLAAGASARNAAVIELIQGSFTPEPAK